jgi:transcriptional regulator GlxA family with amidase domain
LRVAAPHTRRFGSICTGAFLLGAAGLLDRRRVTTHWASCGDLAQRHPAARVEVDPIFIREGGFFSTAGISAGIDLALALVEEDHGREFALHIARYLVLYLKRSGGQAQYSTHLRMQVSEVPAIERVQTWCLDNPAGDLRVSALREIAGMSERDFSRKSRQETGQTVTGYLTNVRMDAACRLLAESRMPMKVIAGRSGFWVNGGVATGIPGASRRDARAVSREFRRLARRRFLLSARTSGPGSVASGVGIGPRGFRWLREHATILICC